MNLFEMVYALLPGERAKKKEQERQLKLANELAFKAYKEIKGIVEQEALPIIHIENVAEKMDNGQIGRYLDIRIELAMEKVSVTNSSLENFFEQDSETGKFSYPPPKNPPKFYEISTTAKAKQELSKEAFETYKKKLVTLLSNNSFEHFRDGQVFKLLADTTTIFCPHNLGRYFDPSPGSMIMTDF